MVGSGLPRDIYFLIGSGLPRNIYSLVGPRLPRNRVEFGYKGLSLMRDDFSGPFVQDVRNFRQL